MKVVYAAAEKAVREFAHLNFLPIENLLLSSNCIRLTWQICYFNQTGDIRNMQGLLKKK